MTTPTDPADVTDADRAKAAELLRRTYGSPADGIQPVRDAIAAALAAERAAVTRPVLALAEEFDRRDAEIPAPFARYDLGYGDAMVFAADRLRRALAGPDDTQRDGGR